MESKRLFASGIMIEKSLLEFIPKTTPELPIQFGKEFVGCGNLRKNQPRIGANPPFGRSESDLLILTFAIQLRCLAHPFIGTVRANPVGAPAPPNGNSSLRLIFQLSE